MALRRKKEKASSLERGRLAENLRLAARVRSLWKKAHAHVQGRLWASHVYGHTDHKWNDRADELARRGKGGAPTNGRGVVGIGGNQRGLRGNKANVNEQVRA